MGIAELPPSKKYFANATAPNNIEYKFGNYSTVTDFRQISRLIHIEAFLDGSVVGDELEDDGDREYG